METSSFKKSIFRNRNNTVNFSIGMASFEEMELIRLIVLKNETQMEFCKRFNISQSTLSQICKDYSLSFFSTICYDISILKEDNEKEIAKLEAVKIYDYFKETMGQDGVENITVLVQFICQLPINVRFVLAENPIKTQSVLLKIASILQEYYMEVK